MGERRAAAVTVRWVMTIAIVIFSIQVWYSLFTESLSYPIGTQNYGVPITFRRFHHPNIERYYPPALVYDLVAAGLTVFAVGYGFWRWSASWPIVVCAAIAGTVAVCGTLILLGGDGIPWPLGLLILVTGLLIGPVAWVCSLIYVPWTLSRAWFGKQFGLVLPICLSIVLLGVGWLCAPHDVLFDRRQSDIPALVQTLNDENPHVRSLALSMLRGIGPYDEVTAMAIIKAMSDPEERVQSNAISLASDLGPYAVQAVPVLRDHFIKNGGCTFELAQLGPIAKDAVPVLREKLPASEGYLKLGICGALWKIDGESTLVVPALIELLSDDFGPIRVDAAKLLGEIGPAARDAAPLLQEMVAYVPKTEDAPSKDEVMPSEERLPVVRMASEAEFYPRIRSAAAEALQRIQRSE